MSEAATLRAVPVAELSADDARIEHASLASEIAEHDDRYHDEDAPTITDAEYDALRRRTVEIEAQYPALAAESTLARKVGAKPSSKLTKIVHAVPMLSLDNTFTDADVRTLAPRYTRSEGMGTQQVSQEQRSGHAAEDSQAASDAVPSHRPGADVEEVVGNLRFVQIAKEGDAHRRDSVRARPVPRPCEPGDGRGYFPDAFPRSLLNWASLQPTGEDRIST